MKFSVSTGIGACETLNGVSVMFFQRVDIPGNKISSFVVVGNPLISSVSVVAIRNSQIGQLMTSYIVGDSGDA
jgi:hypothetical protein